jgi:predicted enzyme related to lactoylglutathione lyase
MPTTHEKFLWYDLLTTDTKAAEAFYRGVIGWDAKDSGVPGQSYTLLSAGSTVVGGLMLIPEDARKAGVPPAWMGYIAVDDVDDYCARIKSAGGALHKGPIDIPGVLRFAVVADPHGAGFMIFRGYGKEAMPPVAPGTLGHVGWHELYAGDRESAFTFYSGLFGWTKTEVVQTPAGPYQLFATGDAAVGGMMTKPPHAPQPGWLYYFNVDAIDAGVGRVKSGGGQVLHGPMQVPGDSWIAQCRDPQGAMFAMVAKRR